MIVDIDTLFSLCGNLVFIGWALLVFSPKRWKWVLVTCGVIIPCVIGALYGALMLTYFTSAPGGGYGSFNEVKALFAKDELMLAGWIHYLAFDLAVGTFIACRADKIGLNRIVQIPILFFTFMFGPAGYLLFVLTDIGWRGTKSRLGTGAKS